MFHFHLDEQNHPFKGCKICSKGLTQPCVQVGRSHIFHYGANWQKTKQGEITCHVADSKQPWMCAPKLANRLSLPSRESAAVRNIIITCSKREEGEREEQLKIGRVWSSFSRQLPRLSQSAIQPASSRFSKRSLKINYVHDTQQRLKIIRDSPHKWTQVVRIRFV